ncbi:hypothetical protein [Pleomorphomonas sp. NRK KF1]|uniref:hypothetical protein n=1 Tax=Pleomorphomonas sp. NRK KF1 TaxID=2943000 RepID=UPI002043912A|nr:hypothetical protein [Pleomorphomonas sp. NRK KF1]MCM5554018.1 hypothetical protein [Pleomorphomonas sp. NRK KF1]
MFVNLFTRVWWVAVAACVLPSAASAQTADLGASSGLWQAAWRHETVLGALSSNQMFGADDGTVDPGLDPVGDIWGTDYWAYADRVTNVFNRKQLLVWKRQVDMEVTDRRVLESAG